MLVITWVTFLFGPGIPILFPIALFGLIVLYVTNRLQLAYWHRRPPVYDYKMNKTTILMLNFGPLLYLMNGAWVYSNQQAFYNKSEPTEEKDLFMHPQHYFHGFWTQLTPGTVFFLYMVILAFIWLTRQFINICKIKRCYNKSKKIQKVHLKQKLANFFSSLPHRARESLIKEELLDRERLNTSKLSKENLASLVLEPEAAEELQLSGIPSYRILRHEISEQFNFINPGLQGQKQTDFVISQYRRPEFKKCSLDVVNAVAYLAFLDPTYAKELEFSTESFYIHRKLR